MALEQLEKLVVSYDELEREKGDLEQEVKQKAMDCSRLQDTIKTLEQFLEVRTILFLVI